MRAFTGARANMASSPQLGLVTAWNERGRIAGDIHRCSGPDLLTGQMDASSQRPYVGSISGVVVLDLKTKEIINRFQSVGISCLNAHPAASGQFFEAVRNLGVFFFQHRNAGRYLVMDEHGYRKISARKHCDNMREMETDCLYVLGILAVCNGYFNGSA